MIALFAEVTFGDGVVVGISIMVVALSIFIGGVAIGRERDE